MSPSVRAARKARALAPGNRDLLGLIDEIESGLEGGSTLALGQQAVPEAPEVSTSPQTRALRGPSLPDRLKEQGAEAYRPVAVLTWGGSPSTANARAVVNTGTRWMNTPVRLAPIVAVAWFQKM